MLHRSARRSALALLVSAVVLASCAPAADLRVPAYDGPAVGGSRLVVVRSGLAVVSAEALAASGFATAAALDSAAASALVQSLGLAGTFADVRLVTLPADVALTPVLVSSQVVTEGRAQNRWTRATYTLPVAGAVGRLGATGDYVLFLDTLRVGQFNEADFQRVRPSYDARTGQFGADVRLSGFGTGRGILTEAPFALYRVGAEAPIVVGDVTGFGIGPEGQARESAWERSVRWLATNLATRGRFAER